MPLINTIFLFFAGQGFFLSFLLHQQKKIKSNPWISFYFLGFSFILCYWVITSNPGVTWQWRAFEFANPIQLIMGPLLLFSISEKQWSSRSYLHFLPAMISVVVLGPAWCIWLAGFKTPVFYVENYVTMRSVLHFGSLLSMIVYSVYIWPTKRTNEHLVLLIALLIFGVGYTLYEILSYAGVMKQWLDYVMSLSMMVSFYAAGYYYLIKYKPYSTKSIHDKESYVHVIDRIETHFKENQVFLNPEYTLENLSKELGESAVKLSQAIGVLGASNFKEYLNRYRIGYAKELLVKSDDKMLVIALESGYNNTVSFSQNFKKFCGVTPGEYRERQRTTLVNA